MITTLPPVFSVSQLNRRIRNWLEHDVGEVCVEGEVSNLSKPASGHYYFTLKDPGAQLRCVYFRNRHTSAVSRDLQNGQQVVARGMLSVYEARGDYQLIIEQLDEAGQGDLFRQFELLKTKLAALGLFDAARKKPLPRYPHCIGVITSATAAALRDILTTLARRYPLAHVLVYPCDVQGKLAAGQLTHAIERANAEPRCDVLILARGGGSMEDLWAFNDERLAHAIANSMIPIVAGVGHETDFTIADFVADLRAATPTAAAEAVTPDVLDLIALLQAMHARLTAAITRFIQHKQLLLKHELQKINSPGQLIATHWQTLDYLARHLHRAVEQSMTQQRHRLNLATTQLHAKHPRFICLQAESRLHTIEVRLVQAIEMKINPLKQRFSSLCGTLHAVSPLATLDRGYAIVMHGETLVSNSQQVDTGDKLDIRLAKGHVNCQVISSVLALV